MERERATETACEGCDNEGQGTDNAPEADGEQGTERERATERACEGCDNGDAHDPANFSDVDGKFAIERSPGADA